MRSVCLLLAVAPVLTLGQIPISSLPPPCQAEWPSFGSQCLQRQFEPGSLFFCHEYVRECRISHSQLFELRAQRIGRAQPDTALCEFYRPDQKVQCNEDGTAKNFEFRTFCDDMAKWCFNAAIANQTDPALCDQHLDIYIAECLEKAPEGQSDQDFCGAYVDNCGYIDPPPCVKYEQNFNDNCDASDPLQIPDEWYNFCEAYAIECDKEFTPLTRPPITGRPTLPPNAALPPVPGPQPTVAVTTTRQPVVSTTQRVLVTETPPTLDAICRDFADEYDHYCVQGKSARVAPFDVPTLCNTYVEKCSPANCPIFAVPAAQCAGAGTNTAPPRQPLPTARVVATTTTAAPTTTRQQTVATSTAAPITTAAATAATGTTTTAASTTTTTGASTATTTTTTGASTTTTTGSTTTAATSTTTTTAATTTSVDDIREPAIWLSAMQDPALADGDIEIICDQSKGVFTEYCEEPAEIFPDDEAFCTEFLIQCENKRV